MKNPHAYRIMFDINAPIDDSHPDLGPQADRATKYITRTAESRSRAGVIDVDPTMFGYAMWAATRRLVMLQQAGMLEHAPDYRTLAHFHGALMKRAAPAEENRKEEMTAGVTAGERFRSWAGIQANAARAASGFAALGLADDSIALMLRNDFPTFEVNMAAGQLGVYGVPINWHFTPEEAGYILADSGAKVLVARRPAGPDRERRTRQRQGAGRADAGGDRRRLQRAAGEETCARGRRDLGFVARHAPNAEPPKAARAMIYHLGHDRPAQGRAPTPGLARTAGAGRRRGRSTGASRPIPDRRDDERADVSLRARGLRHGQRAAWPQHGAAAALRGRGHAAPDR